NKTFSQSQGQPGPLEVIVVGLGRTGTSSLQQALVQLGYPKVYHTRTIPTERPEDAFKWIEFLNQKFRDKTSIPRSRWDNVLGDYNAATDVPCALFYRELAEAYPDAKFILSVRDSPEVWYVSYRDTVGLVARSVRPTLSLLRWLWPLGWLWGYEYSPFLNMIRQQYEYVPDGSDEVDTKRWYEEHNESVKVAIPKGRLLVFNAREGWNPLCQFLQKPVPQHEFPRVFDKHEFLFAVKRLLSRKRQNRLRRLGGSAVLVAAFVLGIGFRGTGLN
ncbi:hypothetical protein GQ53DRAFT_875300, partial [Thozetella sp. PMI_491]